MDYPIAHCYGLYIGGRSSEAASTVTLDCTSPVTGELLTRVPDSSADDVAAAVAAARSAFPEWSVVPPRKRQHLLDAAGDRILADAKRIAWLETANTGKPLRESYANVLTAVDRLRYYAGACRVFEGSVLPVSREVLSLDQRTPLGVVGIIGAWNFPLNMFVGKIAPALAAGNTVVYKPADLTPITTLEIAALFGEVLPAGVVNVVTGTGPTTGAAMVDHPDIRMISVTGSTETGRRVMRGAAQSLKRVTLELGGKNAQVVYPDADLDRTAEGVMLGAFLNQGQVCTAGSRIFVHREIADDLKARVRALLPKLRMGNPFDDQTRMGTLISRAHFERVRSYVELGAREGARVVCGGDAAKVDGLPNGVFMHPALLDEVSTSMRVAREEIFGPVAMFLEWNDESTMLEQVNSVEQGLAAGVWTQSLSRAHAAARAINAGRIWINCYNLFPSGAAFGGTKSSGFGREDAFETMLEFTEVKNVIVDTSPTYRRFYE
jgi:acyl-CoA reductase-like NAD-dependent aldehyde dehydrogenase